MNKLFVFVMIFSVFAIPVFARDEFGGPVSAQNEPDIPEDTPLKKHQFPDNYFGVAVGFGGIRTFDRGIITGALGVSYDFYPRDWISINSGFLLHTELYQDKNLASPLCFTIPFGVHFNIPKIEWLYTGVNMAVNIPIADLQSPEKRGVFTQDDVFISLPLDFGFDFIKPGRGGPRAFFRITPTFHKGGITAPLGLVWQIYNWKVFAKKVDIKIVPSSPKIIIIQ
jgi:hypothetical protein